ncbi:hypothetical protein, partial [Streptomyces sp. t39]|uniref:hypothetical protein n=1 Tax=Streptomyces sp. t39 TaxID=1828156 RepID=UPI001C9CA2D1
MEWSEPGPGLFGTSRTRPLARRRAEQGPPPGAAVVGGLLLAALDQVGHDGRHVLVALERGLGAPDHVADGGADRQRVLLRDAELPGEHQDGQLLREVRDQVGAAGLGELVHELVGVADDVAAHAVAVEPGQAVRHR